MKNIFQKTIFTLLLISLNFHVKAQDIKEKINRRADRASERALDNLEEKVFNTKIKFPKKKDKAQQEEDKSKDDSWNDLPLSHEDKIEPQQQVSSNQSKDLKSYSNYDFILGSKILFAEDFATTPLGDLPDGWNTSSSLEVVELNNYPNRWVKLAKGQNGFTPLDLGEIPENFTLEFDLVLDVDPQKFAPNTRFIGVVLNDLADASMQLGNWRSGNHWIFLGISKNEKYMHKVWKQSEYNELTKNPIPLLSKENLQRGDKIRVSLWKQKRRIRFYLNEEKVFDIVQSHPEAIPFRSLKFYADNANEGEFFYISNIRMGDEPPVIKSQLAGSGILEATGIYFESGSSEIRPESYPSLHQIAEFMKADGGSFSIAGHTDNVGNRESNRLLSEQRASAVRNTLIKVFGVHTNQLASIGFGMNYPLYDNDTAEGRSQNRRVDIINLSIIPNYEERLSKAVYGDNRR
ncbi:OmpA family protein [Belliella kenyensis]|uniref:OmpA family protein n=1 Tax=Belliella kenyensis TaxID=1472724 RepID=A0ABV8ERV0_9BACT|nr:OmpA family protein [Belliella kenyensis]MCH7402207.1 OmpA family protein [Belliella kenyensis]MDN3601721.1 OmpA family protein [Belliella kenyensis]